MSNASHPRRPLCWFQDHTGHRWQAEADPASAAWYELLPQAEWQSSAAIPVRSYRRHIVALGVAHGAGYRVEFHEVPDMLAPAESE